MARKRLLIVYAGGTIGMRPSPSGLAPRMDFVADIRRWLGSRTGRLRNEYVVDVHEPLIDSAEAMPVHWSSLARRLYDRREGFEAAIVLHGTDTLAYTASALSFLLAGLRQAVILTGSQVPFSFIGSDAPANLRGAILCALAENIAEVCVFFDGVLLRGNRTRKSGTRIGNGFNSPHWPALARVKERVELNERALLSPVRSLHRPLKLGRASIGLIKLYPGISGDLVAAAVDAHRDGLVLELYGSGTGPATNPAVLSAVERAAALKTPMVGVSQCAHGEITPPSYVSSLIFNDLGVISGFDLTSEAALTKLHYLHARRTPIERLADGIMRPLAGEITSRGRDRA